MGNRDSVQASFVIPNYQGEKLLSACLNSIYNQKTEVPFEVVVVDDGSTDRSIGLVRDRFPEVKLISNERNQGPAKSKNIGAKEARGNFIAFLDNDVELDEHWLQAIYSRLVSEGETAGACASHLLLNGDQNVINSTGGFVDLLGYAWDRGIFEKDNDSFAWNTKVMYACSAAVLMRKPVFELVGGFDHRYHYLYEDVDLGWRMNACGYEVLYEPSAIAFHRLSSTMGRNGLHNAYLSERNRIHTLKANLEKETLEWIQGELYFHLMRRVSREMRDDDISWYNKLRILLHMLQVRGWNTLHSRNAALRRRELDSLRKLRDWELMEKGVLCPYITEPVIELKALMRRNAVGLGARRPVFRHEVLMELENGGCIGPGWFDREVDEGGAAFRWTAQRASVAMRPDKKRRYLVLRTLMANPSENSRVSLSVNGRALYSFEVPNRRHTVRIPLPEGVEPGLWEVELVVENTFSPWEALGLDDRRELGVAVSSMRLH